MRAPLLIASLTAVALGSGPAAAAVPDGTTFLVSSPLAGSPFPASQVNDSSVGTHGVSANGRYVAFVSESDALGAGDRVQHVYVRDRETDTTVLASRADGPGGAPADGDSDSPAISDNGCRVAFATSARNLGGSDESGLRDIYVRDICTSDTFLVSHRFDDPGATGGGESVSPSINGAGTLVAFESTSASLVAGAQRFREAYVHNLSDGALFGVPAHTTALVSLTNGDAVASTGFVRNPVISRNGAVVAWDDSATDLTASDPNGATRDVFTRSGGYGAAGTTARASTPEVGGSGAGYSYLPFLDDDGNRVGFTSMAPLVGADGNGREDAYLRSGGVTSLLSRADGAGGAVGDAGSVLTGFSESNGWTFESVATNLGGPADGRRALYLRVGTDTTLLSRAPGAGGAPADASAGGTISADGNHVVLSTGARNLLAEASDDFADVLARPRAEAAFDASGYERIDRPNGAGPFTGAVNDSELRGRRSLSADGRFAVFLSDADLMSPDAADDVPGGVYVRDNETGAVTLVSRRDGAAGEPIARPFTAVISGDGTRVAFAALGAGSPDDANGIADVYVRDLRAGTTVLASRAADGSVPGVQFDDDDDLALELTRDGAVVVFDSSKPLVAEDGNGQRDAYVRDLAAGTIGLASGAAAPEGSGGAAISADASTLAWITTAALVPEDANGKLDVYVRARAGGVPVLASRADGVAGAAGDAHSFGPLLSADGSRVAFGSTAENLSDLDPPASSQSLAYVRDLVAGTTTLAARADGAGAAADSDAFLMGLSGDGDRVLFRSDAPALGAAENVDQLFVRDIASGRTQIVSRADGAGGAPVSTRADSAALSAAGTCVLFSAAAAGLEAGGPDAEFESVHGRAVGGACPAAAPDTRVLDGPGPATNDSTPAVAFDSPTPEGSAFECRVDGGGWSSCASPRTLDALPDGSHTFEARAVLRATLTDPTPAARTFVVDTRPPVVRRLRVKPRRFPIARPRTGRAAARGGTSFRFRLSEPASVKITIQRKRGKRFGRLWTETRRDRAAGANRERFLGRVGRAQRLRPGVHRAVVRAIDAAGNRSAPKRVRFRVVAR